MTERLPDVSVVVITFNDVRRVARAIASVQAQTLRNIEIIVVDDASTDGTEQVVAAVAARDPRVRYLRLDTNSGGCSAPRNRGLAEARAPWVMFCDSDDEYERHACKNLLLAAEELDADVVCGKAVRVDIATGKAKDWRPELHEAVQVSQGLVNFPELLYDTISVNKIYRRSLLETHGLAFPEGLLFEDQLFTLQAMALAARIATVPEVVYYWYVDRLSEDLSITQRRAEVRNVESRMRVNELIDDFLDTEGLSSLRRVKDIKFLRHDLHLYLVTILDADDNTARALMERLACYVGTIDLRAAWDIRPLSRVAVYHLLMGDLPHLRQAMRFLRWASVVEVPVTEVDGRQVWDCGHVANGPEVAGIPAAEWLDITELNLLGVPFVERRYAHVISESSRGGREPILLGSTFDYVGDLDPDATGIELQLRTPGGLVVARLDAQWVGEHDGRHTWQSIGAWGSDLHRPLKPTDHGSLAVVLTRAGLSNVTTARGRAADLTNLEWRYPGPAGDGSLCGLTLEQQEFAGLGWHASATTLTSAARGILRARTLTTKASTRLASSLGTLLPDGDVVLAECNGGRQPFGRIAAIAAALAGSGATVAWVDRDGSITAPEGQQAVRRGSPGYVLLAQRCRAYLVDASTPAPTGLAAPVVMVGVAPRVARELLDDPSVRVDPALAQAAGERRLGWDLAFASGPGDEQALRTSTGYRGPVSLIGVPEVPMVDPTLGLPDDRPTVVYAPCPRDKGPGAKPPAFDADAWARVLGTRCYLVIAAYPGSGLEVPTRLRSAIRLDSIRTAAYVTASDLVIGDYGPSTPWAMAAHKPYVGYLPDEADFVSRRHGLYVDVRTLGPSATSMGDLIELVGSWLDGPTQGPSPQGEKFEPARENFREHWCGAFTGVAAAEAAGAAITAISTKRPA